MLHSVTPGTEVDDAAAGEQKQVVKAVRDVAAGLVDGAHDLRPRCMSKFIAILKWMQGC